MRITKGPFLVGSFFWGSPIEYPIVTVSKTTFCHFMVLTTDISTRFHETSVLPVNRPVHDFREADKPDIEKAQRVFQYRSVQLSKPTSQNVRTGRGLNSLLLVRLHPATVHPTVIAESHLESLLDSFI